MRTQEKTDGSEIGTEGRADTTPARPVRIAMMLVLALVLTWICGYWVRQAEIIVFAAQITEAVPSIPGVGVLVLLVAINPLIRRLPLVRRLSSGEIVVVYLLVTVATMMFGCGVGRYLIADISAPFYFTQTPGTPLDKLAPYIPAWLSPSDPVVHLWLHETSPTGQVPWNVWWLPIASWAGFFMLLGGTMLCLMLLMAETWIDHERLVFPLVRLPMEIMGVGTTRSFFHNPVTWAGIGLATLLNVIQIVRSVFFGAPSTAGLYINPDKHLVDYPWRALRPLGTRLRLEVIGLGYLVSTEVSFSIWFFCLFIKLQALGFAMAGYRRQEIPFAEEQGIGAYLVLGIVLLWKSRSAIQGAWRGLISGRAQGQENQSSLRWALLGVVVGIFGLVMFLTSAGMKLWLAGTYLAIILMVAIAYARIRAEAGAPMVWAFPSGQSHKVIVNFLGQGPVIGSKADLASPTIFTMMQIVSRGYFLSVSGYEIEGIRMGQQTGVNWRQISTTLLLGIGFGMIASFIFHLEPFYGWLGTAGPWGAQMSRHAYGDLLHAAQTPKPPDIPRILATSFGGLLIASLTGARSAWLSFPLHPIGYALACAYGGTIWGPFLVVWLLKSLILRYGGSQLYLKVLPGFLGLALGHFLTAGFIWGLLSSVLGGPFLRWHVWFA